MDDELCPVCRRAPRHRDETGSGGISCLYCVKHVEEFFGRRCKDLQEELRGYSITDTEKYCILVYRAERVLWATEVQKEYEAKMSANPTSEEQEQLATWLKEREDFLKKMAEEREGKIIAQIRRRGDIAAAKAQEEAEKRKRLQEISRKYYGC